MSSDPSGDLQLFSKQERIYPKRVSGLFRNLKWIGMIICLAIYYCVPFLRWNRGPNAPDQAVLIDLERGRAYWFWIEIWPQEVYILTGILILAAIGLFFITSLFGRVWCGYLCFQTVWTDLFIWVERIVQGDRNQRKKLREGKWSLEKAGKLLITHSLWLVIAWCTAGSFVLYFNDAPTLVRSFFDFTVSSTTLGFIGGLTFMTYLMAGFAREQVCTFMCPYARFQSAMFDKDTLIIGYNEARGEPRGKMKDTNRGDCIDCTACVQVCPMGIDIRDGLQMECIACGLCIDACDEIMEKIDQPKGLIAYDTENRIEARAKGIDLPFHLMRPRTFYYLSVITLVGSIMLYTLITRAPLEMNILHDRNPMFVQMSNGDIRNGYGLKILNKTHDDHSYRLSVDGLDDARIRVVGAGALAASALTVPSDSVGNYRIFIHAPIKPQAPVPIRFTLEDIKTSISTQTDSMFISRRPE